MLMYSFTNCERTTYYSEFSGLVSFMHYAYAAPNYFDSLLWKDERITEIKLECWWEMFFEDKIKWNLQVEVTQKRWNWLNL